MTMEREDERPSKRSRLDNNALYGGREVGAADAFTADATEVCLSGTFRPCRSPAVVNHRVLLGSLNKG